MRPLKLSERFKSTQVHALSSSDYPAGKSNIVVAGAKLTTPRFKSFGSKPKSTKSIPLSNTLLSTGFPTTDTLEPPIEPCLKHVNLVETLADLYKRLEGCSESQRTLLYIEKYSVLRCLGDPKLLRRCLRTARQNAVDVFSKVVLAAWLRYERREDELVDISSMNCGGFVLECPKANLSYGYNPGSINDRCPCQEKCLKGVENGTFSVYRENEYMGTSVEDSDVSFCIGNEEIKCVRHRIGALSVPLNAMLFGGFKESKISKIDFSQNGISIKGMKALGVYSMIKRLDFFCPGIVLELLTFADRFCCEELKSACEAHLASLVEDIEDALTLIEYGLKERANLIVASCLQVVLRELPNSLCKSEVVNILGSYEVKERFAGLGQASFLLYYFLSQVAMEENMVSNTTIMLLERLGECAKERWQKAIAFHLLGCVLLEKQEYPEAQQCFVVAAEAGHVYSMAGVARTKHKLGQPYSAYKLMSSLIFEYKPSGWMYQERCLYNIGREKNFDLDTATDLDPTLVFPYKYRAIAKLEEKNIEAAILEIDKIIGFKPSPDCLELRAWFLIALGDYESATRDIRALLTLEPNYMTIHGKVRGDYLVQLLCKYFQQRSQAECWMQLYDRWSCVDDIGSLAIIHQMLENEPRKSLLEFRQSLLLLRLNCQKAAIRSLRSARNHSSSMHERLVYEGWILYDTGYREEAICKAEKSILIQRSFEAFFLKAYALADASVSHESSSYVFQLLEEALKCPSDGLRKGQAFNNLGSIYVDCGMLEEARECYMNALAIKHTRAHQGLARMYHLKSQRKAAYDEMTKLIEIAQNSASAYEKRSEYCDHEMAKEDLDTATKLDPLRTYPYRYRAAVMMDDQKESEAVQELTKAIGFKPDLQMLHLRAAFYESIGDLFSALQDCQAALCLDPNHTDTLDLYNRTRELSLSL